MKKTLQDQYLLIKEGKGHKGVFLADAKRQFPNIVRNAATFEEASSCLKTKNIISENVIGLTAVNSPFEPKKKESYELAFENFLAEAKKKQEEDEKAELKSTSKQVEKDLEHNFDRKDDKNPDNLIFDQIMTGYYTEMKDPKNADKTMQELKDMVFKNLQKDPIFYTKEGQFGVKGLGYSVDHPGLGEPKEPKGKYKASGYGDLNEGIHDRDILSRPLSNPDYEPFERSSEELGNEADNRSKNMLLMKYSKQINDPTISDEDLRYILGGKGVKGFGGRPNAIDKIIKDRNEGNKIEDMDSLEREARITLSSKGYSPFSLRSYSRQELIDLANKSESTENKSPEESKLREIIREMIDAELEEAYQLVNINPIKSNKERGEGEPKHKNVYLNPKFIEKLLQNKDIKFITNNEGTRLLIKKNTTINPPVTTDSREKISTPPEIITFLNNGENQEPIIGGGKFPGLNNEMFEYVGLKNVFVGGTPGNRTVRITILNPDVKEIQKEDTIESLQESVEKELAAINKEAEHEIIASKLEKVQTLIDKKQAQISRLDEDEDLKDLTDAKKVKEISKDIKSLEKAKAKLEKMMHKGKAKSPRKEVIDETDETIDEAENEEYIEDAEKRQDDGQKIPSILANYNNISAEKRREIGQGLEARKEI